MYTNEWYTSNDRLCASKPLPKKEMNMHAAKNKTKRNEMKKQQVENIHTYGAHGLHTMYDSKKSYDVMTYDAFIL